MILLIFLALGFFDRLLRGGGERRAVPRPASESYLESVERRIEELKTLRDQKSKEVDEIDNLSTASDRNKLKNEIREKFNVCLVDADITVRRAKSFDVPAQRIECAQLEADISELSNYLNELNVRAMLEKLLQSDQTV